MNPQVPMRSIPVAKGTWHEVNKNHDWLKEGLKKKEEVLYLVSLMALSSCFVALNFHVVLGPPNYEGGGSLFCQYFDLKG